MTQLGVAETTEVCEECGAPEPDAVIDSVAELPGLLHG